MATLHEKTEKMTQMFRDAGFRVIEMWEHDFQRQKKNDEDLKSFIASHTLQDRLNPRDSFFGGRTNTLKLYSEGNIKYVDFTSLYPWVSLLIR